MPITPEPFWKSLFSHIKSTKGTIMLLGDTDTGKSTLAKYIIEKFLESSIPVSFVDSDIGQSILCLPGTVSMRIFRTFHDFKTFLCEKMCFVGTVNPTVNLQTIIVSTVLMHNQCRDETTTTLIDTTGLIHGDIGISLKVDKIRSIQPEKIIAVQYNNELEHILSLIQGTCIHRIAVASSAKKRKREERIRYRFQKLSNYFSSGQLSEFLLDCSSTEWFYHGKTFNMKQTVFPRGNLIGLNHHNETAGIGVITDMDRRAVTFVSPLSSLKQINRVVFGDIRIDTIPCQE